MPPADNTRFLAQASQRRSQHTRQLAEQTITAARQHGQQPTVAAIARAAGVSRSWLYTQRDLIAAIAQLQQRQPVPSRTGPHPASTQSLQRRLETTLARNKQLRRQVDDLTRRLEAAHGELRRLQALGNPTHR
jgi:sirohydrochlorin ferrochelatase